MMLKKIRVKIKSVFLFFITILSFSVATIHAEEMNENAQKADLLKEGLILPDSGLQIIPATSKEFAKSSPVQNQIRSDYLAKLREMASKGFSDRYSTEAVFLFSMKDKIATTEYDLDPHDTHLKTDLSKIRLAFPYHSPFLKQLESPIGFSPRGGWIDGWTGFSVYFNDKEMGICKFAVTNIKTSHGGIRLVAEDLTHDVNNKATSQLLIEGSAASGYLYNIEWYDDTFIRELQCAAPLFDPIIAKKLVSYAKLLDKEVN